MSQTGPQSRLEAAFAEARRSEFATLHEAIECANYRFSLGENQWIVIGDQGVYWVLTPAMARLLVNAGYNLAFGN